MFEWSIIMMFAGSNRRDMTRTSTNKIPFTGYLCLCIVLLSKCIKGVQGLSMWIDGRETEQFVGEPFDIYVISEGVVVPYLKDAIYDAALPILPPEVRLVQLTWMASDDVYFYKFSDLRSLDPNTLYDPLLSIPKFGIVPKKKTVFQMTIPCTGRDTAIASMYIVLHIHNVAGAPIRGSPIKLHLRKRCIAFAESRQMCHDGCHNGGTCNEAGRCDCPRGYLGDQCQHAVCFPGCVNNGTCVKPGQCQCQEGFVGHSCEIAICRNPCQNGGYCFKPGLCECPEGFYGEQCQHKEGECHPPCLNGGTCTTNDTCMCLNGYTGQLCQKPECKHSCGSGFCADVDVCQCYQGWRGRFCNKRIAAEKMPHRKRKKSRKAGHLEDYDEDSDHLEMTREEHEPLVRRRRRRRKRGHWSNERS